MDAMDMEGAPEDQDQEKRKYIIPHSWPVSQSIWDQGSSTSDVEMVYPPQDQVECETAIHV